jgi:hypothetical protein
MVRAVICHALSMAGAIMIGVNRIRRFLGLYVQDPDRAFTFLAS